MPSYRSLTLAALAAGAFFALGGCGDDRKAAEPVQQPAISDLPDWYRDPTKGGTVIGGAGSYRKAPGMSLNHQKEQASLAARKALADTLETKIQGAVKQFEQTAGEVYKDADKTMTMQFAQATAKGITNKLLTNTPAKDLFVDKATGELFVWIVVDPKIAEQLPKMVTQDYKAQMEAKMGHIAAKLEAQKAFDALEADVQKEINGGGK